MTDTPEYFQNLAPQNARLKVNNKKFAAIFKLVQDSVIQKISASDEGYLTLQLYKPKEGKVNILLSIKKGQANISRIEQKPPSQPKPNGFVQMARKYMLGRRIELVFATMSPVTAIIKLYPPTPGNQNYSLLNEGPECFILDFDAKPPRVCLAKIHDHLPERYKILHNNYQDPTMFFESFYEWTYQSLKTKRRATFEEPPIEYSVLWNTILDEEDEEQILNDRISADVNAQIRKAIQECQEDNTPTNYIKIFPKNIRRAAKTRLQFLERRLKRQQEDLPSKEDLTRLKKVCLGLQSYLYMWPENSKTWYVPSNIIEEYGLRAVYQLESHQTPGDLLNSKHKHLDKLARRQQELEERLLKSKEELKKFESLILSTGKYIQQLVSQEEARGELNNAEILDLIENAHLENIEKLSNQLKTPWKTFAKTKSSQKKRTAQKLPYRTFYSQKGEFIRVAKSSKDGDTMIKLMPTNHLWLHTLTGEGSHVWLEKKKKQNPTSQSIREAAILALHFSKQSKNRGGEVRISPRSGIEKKKDLPPGKVLVRKCNTKVFKYTEDELQKVLETGNNG